MKHIALVYCPIHGIIISGIFGALAIGILLCCAKPSKSSWTSWRYDGSDGGGDGDGDDDDGDDDDDDGDDDDDDDDDILHVCLWSCSSKCQICSTKC